MRPLLVRCRSIITIIVHDGHVGGDGELGFNLVRSSRGRHRRSGIGLRRPVPWWLTLSGIFIPMEDQYGVRVTWSTWGRDRNGGGRPVAGHQDPRRRRSPVVRAQRRNHARWQQESGLVAHGPGHRDRIWRRHQEGQGDHGGGRRGHGHRSRVRRACPRDAGGGAWRTWEPTVW